MSFHRLRPQYLLTAPYRKPRGEDCTPEFDDAGAGSGRVVPCRWNLMRKESQPGIGDHGGRIVFATRGDKCSSTEDVEVCVTHLN